MEEKKARDVYDSVKAWTCRLGKIEKLYAFSYQPQKPEKDFDGWSFYNARQEFKRLGVSEKGADRGWRISTINNDYSVGMGCLKLAIARSLYEVHSSPQHIQHCLRYPPTFQTIHSNLQAGIAQKLDCLRLPTFIP